MCKIVPLYILFLARGVVGAHQLVLSVQEAAAVLQGACPFFFQFFNLRN
jgi:hypothetical protein